MELSTFNLPSDKKINLVLANFANAYLKPVLLTPHPIIADTSHRFDNHTPFPTRDNVALYAGKPVIETVILECEPYEVETYNDKTKTYDKAKINGTKITLDTVLVDVAISKNVVKTEIDGQNGTVKEYISDGDYKVSIRGAIVNDKGTNYPFDEFKKLNAIVKAPISVAVTSYFLSLFPIHSLVIESVTFPQKEGYTNTQLFEISCVSDNAIDIIKINK